jgi:Tfp pilus assembly protein PilO
MNKLKMQKIILFSLIAIAVGYVVYNYYIMATNQKIIALTQEIKSKEALFKELDEFSKTKKDAAKQIGQLEMANTILSEKIPDYNCSTEFTTELYSLTTNKSMRADNININSSEEGEYGVIKISLDTTGKIDDIKQIISYFKNHKRKLLLKSFRMQTGTDDAYTASLNLELYYQKSKL